MRKILPILFLSFLATLSAQAQQARRVFTTTSVAADSWILEAGFGVQYHQLTWNISGGTAPTCQVQLDYSVDGITSAGTIIATQACSSNGASSISTLAIANYVRINVTVKSGAGTATITYLGYTSQPSGGGTVIGTGALNQVAVWSGASSLGGSAGLTFNASTGQLTQLSSCGLTAVGENVVCGPGLGTSYGGTPVVQEVLQTGNSQFGTCWTAPGLGNTGTTRDNFVCTNYDTTNGTFAIFHRTHLLGAGLGAAILFDADGSQEVGVNNSDLTQTETYYHYNGPMVLLVHTGDGVQTTASSDAATALSIASHSATQTAPLSLLSNAPTSATGSGVDVVRGIGIADPLGFSVGTMRTTVTNSETYYAQQMHNLSGPMDNSFFIWLENNGDTIVDQTNDVTDAKMVWGGDGRFEINPDASSVGVRLGHSTPVVVSPTGGVTIPSTSGTSSTIYKTATDCTSSTGACGSAAAGSFTIAAAATTRTVATTAVSANSVIILQFDSSLGTKLGVTCNTTVDLGQITGRVAATSFTVTAAAAPAVNPACYSYWIVSN